MNIYDARELKSGGWHYTVEWQGVTSPAACCSGCVPHPTELEARQCAARWVVETASLAELSTTTSVPRCSITTCDALVSCESGKPNAVSYGFGMKNLDPLCNDHLADGVAMLVGDSCGVVWSS